MSMKLFTLIKTALNPPKHMTMLALLSKQEGDFEKAFLDDV